MKIWKSRLLRQAILAGLLLLGAAKQASAYTDPTMSSALRGSLGQIAVGRSDTTKDTKFFSLAGSIDTTYSLQNIVSLSIDPLSTAFISSDFTTNIKIEIKTTDAQWQTNTIEKILTVNYKKGPGEKYDAIQYCNFQNAVIVEVKILEITSNVAWNTTQVLLLKNELTANRDYAFNCTTPIQNLHFAPIVLPLTDLDKPDEITVSWNDPNNGQTEYDLEWAWVDASALALLPTDGTGNYIQQAVFENNATRVTITNAQYNVPLLYDGDGKIFVRVRPAQTKNNGQRKEGAWSVQNNAAHSFTFTGHATLLNWQASNSYAEEGKRKSVVQYFDGTLRNRQTVTKDNTTQTTVVAETFYDYQGRPVIQVLPSPTLSNIIQYAQNFNRSITTDGYPKTLYDKLDGSENICSKISPGFSTASGTAQYYSPNNPLLAATATGGINKFIPNSEGPNTGEAYPFTETRYDPDGSGRVASQGGVGFTHQLGSGHETKYFYEGVSQTAELDPLFGTDAGIASHYFKNIVKDANGQYSISYSDMHGRTIATALAGASPASLDALPSFANAEKQVTRDLLPPGTNIVQGKTIKSSQPLVVLKYGKYEFNYELSPDNLILKNCDNTIICYDCLYTLNITIASDCNATPPIVRTKKNFTIGQYLKDSYGNICPPNGKSPSINIPIAEFTEFLAEGAYTVTKELTLSSEAQNYYRDSIFVPADTCKTLQRFVKEAYDLLIANANCNITCATCTTALGANYTEYRAKLLLKLTALTAGEIAALEPQFVKAYEEAKASCASICAGDVDDGNDYIKSIREIMLQDVTPGTGQYARYDRPVGQTDPETGTPLPALNYTTLKYNIFDTADEATVYGTGDVSPAPDWKHGLWYNPTTQALENDNPYKDIFGQADPVNALINTPATTYTQEQFGADFKETWAISLLPHHPEYCKLRELEDKLPPTYAFEATLQRVKRWQDAFNATTPQIGGYIMHIVENDPFFSLPGNDAYRTEMLNKINVRYRTFGGSGGINNTGTGGTPISMWQMAQGIVFCRNQTNTAGNPAASNCFATQLPPNSAHTESACDDWNRAWEIFRTLYLTERKNYIAKYLDRVCPPPTETLFTDGTYQLRFQNLSGGTYNTGDPELDTVLLQISGGTSTSLEILALLGSQADATCRSYAATWLNVLRKCPTIKTALETNPGDQISLIDNLVGICKKGFDAAHPAGASSISPNTTPYNGFSNFPEVIKAYLNAHGVNAPWSALCNPYLITVPAPYDKTPVLANQYVITKPSECQCTRLQTLKTEHNQHPSSGTFSNYLLSTYGTRITQGALDTLLSLCSNNPITSCNFLNTAITIPPILQCEGPLKTCITCAEYNTIKAGFLTEFAMAAPILNPQTQAELDINDAFANFANTKTGFSKLWSAYRDFEITCAKQGIGITTTTGANLAPALSAQSPVTNASCASLEAVFQAYYNTYINPPGGTVDLDIRTFYGNKTPCTGEVGVFDINGDLVGNTSLDPINGNFKFASIWNTSNINNAVGTLSGIKGSCKVRLTLNKGQVAPCNGIIGMRYYTFVNPNAELDGIMTGPGCYIDFDDGYMTKVDTALSSGNTTILKINPIPLSSKPISYNITHTYATSGSDKGWTVKVYHSDTLGVVGFDSYATGNDGNTPALTKLKELKGYFPEQTRGIVFHSTQDTSLNTFSKIANIKTFFGVQWFQTFGHGGGVTPFLGYNFGRFDNYHDIEYLSLAFGYPGFNNIPEDIIYLKNVITNPLNASKLKFLSISAEGYTDDVVINYPKLTAIDIQNGLLSYQVDTIINQIARYTVANNGQAFLGANNQPRTSASDNAYNALIARGWVVFTDGDAWPAPMTPENAGITDTAEYRTPAISQFSEYFSAVYNAPNTTLQQVLNTYQQNCGYTLNLCAPLVNNTHCDTLKNVLSDYINTNYQVQPSVIYGIYNGYNVVDYNNNVYKVLAPVTIQDCIHDGIFAGYPDTIHHYPGILPSLGLVDWNCRDMGPGFSIELRSRLQPDFPTVLAQTYLWHIFYFENGKFFRTNSFYQPNGVTSNTGFHSSAFFPPIYLDTALIRSQVELKDWHTTKYTFNTDNIAIYVNGSLKYQLPCTLNPRQVSGLQFQQDWGTPEQIDYIKFIDAYGNTKWQEDFNSAIPPKIPYELSCTKITCGATGNAFAAYYNARFGTNYTYQQLVELYLKCGIVLDPCNTSPTGGPLLCGLADPIAVEDSIHLPSPCDGLDSVAATIGEIRYNMYLDSLRNVFDTAYYNKCMKAGALEQFTVKYTNAEYHYTLYYYDQAGNLVRTVPPEGVDARHGDQAFLTQVAAKRALVKAGTPEGPANRVVPLHAQDAVLTSTGEMNGAPLATNYRYNTLNQVIAQKTPDAGISNFYYDRLGRLVLSQNAQQKLMAKISYTQYDYLGRISQVGQIAQGTIPDTRDQAALATWLAGNAATKEQITRTVYDVSYFNGETPPTLVDVLVQRNLRNRVSYTQVFATEPAGSDDTRYAAAHRAATYYSYDIHGNVDTLMQDYGNPDFVGANGMNVTGNRFKKIAYNYDLISGKVNKVSYQPGYADEFYHRYTYDAENRITLVETSHDDIWWERDARYTYYKHGPLARTIIGEEQVQGIDYAYTLQGWLKGVNTTGLQDGNGNIGQGEDCGPNSAVNKLLVYNRAPSLPATYKARIAIDFMPDGFESAMPDNFTASVDPALAACDSTGIAGDPIIQAGNLGINDMGQDGRTNASGQPVLTGNLALYGNNTRTLDAYGYSLNYFKDDYKKISTTAQAPNPFASILNGTGLVMGTNIGKELFNGNIAAMAVSIPKLSAGSGGGLVYGYSYDQLNRITGMTAFSGLSGTGSFTPIALDKYKENISYDANGNILSYKHNGDKSNGAQGYVMDNLTYQYNKTDGKLQNNKLRQVTEALGLSDAAYTDDIDNQTDPNNYVYDAIGNLTKDTKEHIANIEWTVYGKISRITKDDGKLISYTYDASGNRISKIVSDTPVVTYYVRDASGNVMSVYATKYLSGSYTATQAEIHLYGSSRLGIYNINRDVTHLQPANHIDIISTFERGNKFFELSNHLGNVFVTVSDKKIQHTSSNTTVEYYTADVVTANDYYPFGMQMPGRKFTQPNSSYRYSYNGQEKTNEISGAGNHTTAMFWEYDTRTGIRWNRDPVVDPSISPYATNEDNPIKNSDPNGDCSTCPPPQVNVSIGIKFGSHNKGVSFKLSVTQNIGDFSLSAGIGVTQFSSFMNTGKSGTELRGSAMAGYDDGKTGVSLGTNVFKGLGGMSEFKQRTGILNFRVGSFSGSYENDGTPFPKLGLSDGNDSYRTAAARIGVGDFSAGFNLFTGLRDKASYKDETSRMGVSQRHGDENATTGNYGVKMPHGFVTEKGPQYRMGAAYVGYGQAMIGITSDRYVRHPIQDIFAHHTLSPQPGFQTLSKSVTPFYQMSTPNPFRPINTPRFTLYD